ncbi:DNA polymerase III subunit epsilon [Agromyces protaetiae]|uniref:DNA polymerase III subunit epsilon n=1 Tax=Agromyces protaetiae TaxID=2509455 RepID=A0A4P6FT19_9MICO|nr:exonuclease domain-containing protein [Agromyces protaetiae]QAY73718.1 DNA polymerase III subunit epsilon [Agromyces protaetiae]
MPGYAVVDLETTGFSPRYGDRIVEIAVVHVNEAGRITGEWDTLVNPERDLGPVHVHGVRAADVMRAPRFIEVADELLRLLAGRVVVAHNARFDLGFLAAEFARAGYAAPAFDEASLCTMLLARQLLPGAGRALADCCAAFDIEIGDAHQAAADAHATALLLSEYLLLAEDGFWWGTLDRASEASWPSPTGAAARDWMPRPANTAPAPAEFLVRITVKLPEFAGPVEQQQYLALLDRALLDRHLSAHEADSLVALAEELGISRSTCETLHERYFDALVDVAWADGVLEVDEIADLAAVAKLLAVPGDRLAAAINGPTGVTEAREIIVLAPTAFALQPGDHLVITGELSAPRSEWHRRIEAAGFVPRPAVTQQVKLVIAADPDSLSGKAAKARAYGIPIVGEAHLERLLAG